MPGFQHNTVTVYGLYRETGDARSASPLLPIPTFASTTCGRSDTNTCSKSCSVCSFHSKWITVSKHLSPRAEYDPGHSGPSADWRPKVGQRSLLPLVFHGTQPASLRIPALYVTKGLNTQPPHNALDRLVHLGPLLNEELWVGANDVRVQRGGGQVRRRVARVRAWPENVGVGRVEAACFVGDRVSYRIHWYGGHKLEEYKEVDTIDLAIRVAERIQPKSAQLPGQGRTS